VRLPLLKKYAEDQFENNNLGPVIGTMAGATLSSILSPRISASFTDKVVPKVEDLIKSPEFYNNVVTQMRAEVGPLYPGAGENELNNAANLAAKRMKAEAMSEFIQKPTNPYFKEAQKRLGKASRKSMVASLALGLSLPLLGSIVGAKLTQNKPEKPQIL